MKENVKGSIFASNKDKIQSFK